MRILYFIPAALLAGMVACNNADNKTSTSDTTKAAATDTMAMAPKASDNAVPALPPVPPGSKVYFKNLKDGETVKSPVKVEMGVDGMKLDTAGSMAPGTGHHHLLIDAGDSIAAGMIVPKDSTHRHFGKAQSSTEVNLTPGKHVLTLQFADGLHRSFGSKMAATITVNVK